MSLIQINTENLHNQSGTVRTYRQQQETTINQIRNIIYSLEDGWKGEAQETFVAKFRSMEITYKKLYDILEKYADLMDKAADEMQAVDQNIKRMIQNI